MAETLDAANSPHHFLIGPPTGQQVARQVQVLTPGTHGSGGLWETSAAARRSSVRYREPDSRCHIYRSGGGARLVLITACLALAGRPTRPVVTPDHMASVNSSLIKAGCPISAAR